MYVPRGESVSFVAKFDDYADPIHPFMYHCHFANHEDDGMMGQFVVTSSVGVNNLLAVQPDFILFPNPVTDRLYVSFPDPTQKAYYVRVLNASGKTIYMLPKPELENGIDISGLAKGIYFLQLTDEKTKITTSKKFIVE